MSIPQRLFRRTGVHPAVRSLAALGGAVFLALILASCEPRQHVPRAVEALLDPEREAAQYRRLVLPNGMKVLLISDPRADRSGAALSVGVGSLSDPPGRPGLAHFLEHMLFLGTEKYPQAGEYQAFMGRNAGYSNAYTADDHTNYHFEVANSAFPEGLDRFAQFFIAPTLDTAYAQREMNAVDAEHAKNVENDYWRTRQIQRDQYKPGHPMRRFSTGDRTTLVGVEREELLAFYQQHYSANRMTLAVVSNAGLDQQEQWVRERFLAVPNRKLPPNRFPSEYLERKAALRLITVEPVADVRSLDVEFPLPAVEAHYRAKPLSMIGFVLGHEGKGSLLSLLKAEGLATSLSAGYGEATKDYASFHITVGLTPEGLRRYPDVLAHVLGAIAKLRQTGIPRYLYEETRTLAALDFHYRERTGSAQRASRMSALMQELPLEELPEAAYLYQEYAPELYRALLERMTPDNMLITLMARGVPTDRTQPNYRARYGYQELADAEYARLAAAQADPRWKLPEPNPFIPRDTALIRPQGALKISDITLHHLRADGVPAGVVDRLLPFLDVTFSSGEALVARLEGVLSPEEQRRYLPLLLKDSVALPRHLLNQPLASVWYLPDWRFRQPKAEVILKVFTEDAFRTPRDVALARLYEAGLAEALDEFAYPVREAGLNFEVTATKSGFTLRFGGYSSGLLALMDLVAARLKDVDITPERFAAVKERMQRGLENQRFDQPYQQSSYYRELLLTQPAVSREAQLAALAPVTLADVRGYARRAYRRVYVQGVVAGNLVPDAARAAIEKLLSRLDAQPLPPALRVEEEIRSLPAQANQVFSQRLDVNNSVINAYYQAGRSEPRLRGALLIIGRRLQDSYYQSLRTQQQLGYIVWAGMGQTRKTLNFTFIVQSGAYPADVLLERTEQFIPRFIAEFKALPEVAFEGYRTAVIQAKLERDHNLGETAQRLFWVAFQNDAKWDYVSEDIRAVESLKRAEVERILERVLTGDLRRRLVIRLIGKEHKAGPPKGQVITLPGSVRTAAIQ